MTKILLVYVNSFMDNLIPVGVSILSSYLKNGGHEVKLFDTTFYRTSEITGDEARVSSLQIKNATLNIIPRETLVKDFAKTVDEFKPDIIGFSVVESTVHIYKVLLSITKGYLNYKGIVITGGIFPSTSPELALMMSDMICIGEGEQTLLELADRVDAKQDYKDIKNIWMKDNGNVIKNPIRPLIDMNSLPFQDWSIYEKQRLQKPMGGKIWISGSVELSRGCHMRCAFCCNAFLQDLYKEHSCYVRQKTVDNFIDEVKQKQHDYHINYLYLVAENFLSMNSKDFNRFIELYSKIRLPFWIETRPETVTLDKVTKLKVVGCEGISIGVEHGNEQFRREVLNRFVSNQTIIKAFEIAKQSGIRVCANNIIGFPTETRELVFDTIELNRQLIADNVIVNIFCPYRGTKLFELSVMKKYISEWNIAGDYRGIDAGLDMPQLSQKEIIGLQRTFPLYVKFPKEKYQMIKEAETNDSIFEILSSVYREKFL
jgi:anaerobic magnesium-protoporphyrin IX monomethyl ester cyclase